MARFEDTSADTTVREYLIAAYERTWAPLGQFADHYAPLLAGEAHRFHRWELPHGHPRLGHWRQFHDLLELGADNVLRLVV